MDKTTTQKSETTTLTLDEALGKIDAMLAPEPATVETEKSFSTRADFDAYVLEEIAKAEAETVVEARTERLTALKAAIEIAKVASWEQSSTTTIKLFVDKWQVKRPATSTEVSATVNKAADAVETVKNFIAPLYKALAATDGTVSVAKAGEATAALGRLAKLFGIQVGDGGVLDCELRWQVGDAVSALQQAAKMEAVLEAMTGIMKSSTEAPAPAETPAETPVVEAPVVKSAVEKAGDAEPTVKRVGQYEDGEGWPIDMNG